MADDAEGRDARGRAAGRTSVLLLALVAGTAVGLVGGAFRWTLARADVLRVQLQQWAHTVPFGVLASIGLTALAAAAAAALVRASPRAAGSGIQDVEAVDRGQVGTPPLSVVPVRFVGGVLAIGGGLVLGREGPTVHIGAALGAAAGRFARLRDAETATLHTALSGAGLAVAFNAPIGGALFVLEEVAKSARLRLVVPAVLAVAAAVAAERVILGDRPDFAVAAVPAQPLTTLPVFVVLGVLIGLVGALYSRTVTGVLAVADSLHRVPPVLRATVVGALVGAALFVDPLAVGGGDQLSQLVLAGHGSAPTALLALLALRFVAGPLSYAAGTPGGIFAPLLALGAVVGALFAGAVEWAAPGTGPDLAVAAAVVGMSALFAAVVQAPLTGVALIVEMTAVTTVTVPMLLAAGVAVVTARLLRTAPVYDTLRERMLAAGDAGRR